MLDTAQEVARIGELKQRLLPREICEPFGWSVAVYAAPCPWPGGDYYDQLPFPDGQFGFLLADASGHGGLAAVMVAITRVVLHSCPLSSGRSRQPYCPLQGRSSEPPHRILAHLNQVLVENTLDDQFMTAVMAFLQPENGTLTVASAGHPLPRWWRASRRAVQPVPVDSGLPLGLEEKVPYEAATIEMKRGDVLVCYTDGVTEAENDHGEMFGLARLDRVLKKYAPDGAEAVKDGLVTELHDFLEDRPLQDDATVLVLGRSG